jgi:hypothetical protein
LSFSYSSIYSSVPGRCLINSISIKLEQGGDRLPENDSKCGDAKPSNEVKQPNNDFKWIAAAFLDFPQRPSELLPQSCNFISVC